MTNPYTWHDNAMALTSPCKPQYANDNLEYLKCEVDKPPIATTPIGTCTTPTYTNLTGTFAVTNGSATVTGTGSKLTTEASAGDVIQIAGVNCTVASVTNDNSLTMTSNFTGTTATGLTVNRATTEKDVTLDNFELQKGLLFNVNFVNENVANSCKMTFNGGATSYPLKNIYGNDIKSLPTNSSLVFFFDGQNIVRTQNIINTAPDYTKSIAKAWGTQYIAQNDGYVYIFGQSANWTGIVLSINSFTIVVGVGGDAACDFSGMYRLSKGDAYIATGGTSGQALTFIPCKGDI